FGRAAFDAAGNLWVGDAANNRVLRYSPPFSTGMSANLVLGQSTFTGNAPNAGGLSARSLRNPTGIVIDVLGNVYFSDQGNRRVLMYRAPQTSGMDAAIVLGRDSFTQPPPSGSEPLTNSTMSVPTGLAVDRFGNLIVADVSRVMVFTPPCRTVWRQLLSLA